MKKAMFLNTPIGVIGLAAKENAVTNVFFANTVRPAQYSIGETPLLALCAGQMREYFDGRRRSFALPLVFDVGTSFERSVWAALCTIPYGETRTYAQLAQIVGRPSACRAVGRANGRNPLSILVPCHRVIGSNGKLTGYAGGLKRKEFLLRLEHASL